MSCDTSNRMEGTMQKINVTRNSAQLVYQQEVSSVVLVNSFLCNIPTSVNTFQSVIVFTTFN